MSTIKDMFARGLAVVAIVIAIIFGLLSLAGHGNVSTGEQKVANAYGQIYDTFTGDYFNAYRGFQLNGANIFGVDSTVFTLPSNVTSTSVNGVVTTYGRVTTLTAATTTVCAIQSPAATSTLQFGSLKLTVGSTTAITVTLAKSSTAFATTTLLNSASIAAGAQGTVIASTTESVNPDGLGVFSPSTWFVAGIAGGTGTFSPTGICQVTWITN